MSWDPDKIRVQIARDLREIEQLYVDLHWQALASSNDRDLPGGRALNMLGPVADADEWERQYEEAEREVWESDDPMTVFSDYASDQIESDVHPLYVMGTWVRIIREERDQPTGLDYTLSRCADYLRKNLDWMSQVDEYGEPIWPEVDEVAKDLEHVRRSMENVLAMGSRLDTSAAACFMDDTTTESGHCGGRLVRANLKRRECEHVTTARQFVEGMITVARALAVILAYFPHVATEHKNCDQGGRDDIYRCLKCEKRYTNTEYWLAVAEHHEKEAG